LSRVGVWVAKNGSPDPPFLSSPDKYILGGPNVLLEVHYTHKARSAGESAAGGAAPSGVVRILEPGLRQPRAKKLDARRKNAFRSATLLYSCVCSIFKINLRRIGLFLQNCFAITVDCTDFFSGYKAVTVVEVGLVSLLKHPACDRADSTQGCIALCCGALGQ